MAFHDDMDFELEMALAASQNCDEEAFILQQIEMINAMEGRNQPETINRNTNEHNRPLVDNGVTQFFWFVKYPKHQSYFESAGPVHSVESKSRKAISLKFSKVSRKFAKLSFFSHY